MGRTPGGHAPLFAFHSGTSLNSSSLVRAVTGKSPRLFSLARPKQHSRPFPSVTLSESRRCASPPAHPARALFRAGGPTRKTRAAGQRHHVSLCQLLANACMAASRVGS